MWWFAEGEAVEGLIGQGEQPVTTMATADVACPYCGVETKVTIPRGGEVTEVSKGGLPKGDVSDAGCPNGHLFEAAVSRPRTS